MLIKPHWPAPAHIHAYTTTRVGGVSKAPYASLNLGNHVGDDKQHVMANRNQLRQQLKLASEPCWLQQVHENTIVDLDDETLTTKDFSHHSPTHLPIADGSYTRHNQRISVIMSADCLPILITDTQGSVVMALHGSWRSLAANIIERGIALLPTQANNLLAWLGPAIGPDIYEVGDEVKQQLLQNHGSSTNAFKPSVNGRWLMNIYNIARQRLVACGVASDAIFGGDLCTFSDEQRFFSYRRDAITGRMASLIYKTK